MSVLVPVHIQATHINFHAAHTYNINPRTYIRTPHTYMQAQGVHAALLAALLLHGLIALA